MIGMFNGWAGYGTAALPLYHGPCTGRETPPTPDYISAENGEINQSVIYRDPRSDPTLRLLYSAAPTVHAMIPEFPLPPNEADFYHSKLYERPPLFGVFTRFELPELTLAQKETIVNPIDLTRPLKMAEIRCKQNIPTPKTSRTFSKPSLLNSLTNLTQSIAYT